MMNSENICRICLKVSSVVHKQLNEELVNIIKNLTSIKIFKEDELPKSSCQNCTNNLYFIDGVRKKIIASDSKLRNIFLNYGNFDELLTKTNTPVNIEIDSKDNKAFLPEPFKNEYLNPTDHLQVSLKEDTEGIIKLENTKNELGEGNVEECDNKEINRRVSKVNEEATSIRKRSNCKLLKSHTSKIIGKKKRGNPKKSLVTKERTKTSIKDQDKERSQPSKKRNIPNYNGIIYTLTNTKPFKYHCKVCEIDFTGHSLLRYHRNKHCKKPCEVCGLSVTYNYFNKHMQNHLAGQQICDICGSVHKTISSLSRHKFHQHKEKEPYACEECGANFKYSVRLQHHKRTVHIGFRPHVCDTCGKSFFTTRDMKKHNRMVHLKLRTSICEFCNKGFSSPHALKVHRRQHTNETPYVCEICSEGFRQPVLLRRHMRCKHSDIGVRENDKLLENEDQL